MALCNGGFSALGIVKVIKYIHTRVCVCVSVCVCVCICYICVYFYVHMHPLFYM